MLIGATMNAADLPALAGQLAGNNIMRIFPVDTAVAGGKTGKVLPAWTDARFMYCKNVGAIPFVSTKVDGDPAALAYVKRQLMAMPDWVTQLYITDRHEPEGDLSPQQFQANFTAFLAMITALPPALRERIRCGPVLTRTWTEQPGAGRAYDTYDPGNGDFFGVDMYVQSGTAKTVVTPATIPSPADFTAGFRAYRKSPSDTRPRIWPEWGLIGMPDDTDGAARAAWIRGVYRLVRAWGPDTTGWLFLGMLWWNSPGKATGVVAQIGQRRDFPLSMRTVPAMARSGTAEATGVTLPGTPPAPVAAYNAIFAAEQPIPEPGPSGTYQDGWRDGRAALLQQITELTSAPAP